MSSTIDQLGEARKAIAASIAMMRALELQLCDLENAHCAGRCEHTERLCKQTVELRDLLRFRMTEMDVGVATGRNYAGPSPSRVKAGSRVVSSSLLRRATASIISNLKRGASGESSPGRMPNLKETAAETSVLDRVSGVLIDLDGTMYNPHGAIPGADGAPLPCVGC